MIQLKVTGINSDKDAARVTDQLENIGSLSEIMVTLTNNSAATIIVTGQAEDEVLRAAVSRAGGYSISEIQRQRIDPYNGDR